VKDVREVLAEAQRRIDEARGRTILFLDEIHRFNKAQQDALLPGVEDGTVVLVGATTENPFFEVNSPLISRATVFRTVTLDAEDVAVVVQRAHADAVRGLGGRPPLDTDAVEALAERVGGDARLALNTLEAAAAIAAGRGAAVVDVAVIEEALQRRVIRYDKAGDRHYDVISAFIKSMRGSDPDAAVYWLHVMLEAGEDPEFIARRIVIFASEDVGLADPNALTTAVAAFEALRFVGLPEAAFHLTHAALAMATAPKSASVKAAMGAAGAAVRDGPVASVPPHLRAGATAGDRAMGHGVGYAYPHDDPLGVVRQQYLPDGLEESILFQPGEHGDEAAIAERQAKIDRILGKPERSDGDE
jgi:putative ATPase